jgi:PUA domain protein
VATQLEIKKRRPINKKEAKLFNQLLTEAHDFSFTLSAGKYETAKSRDFDVIIQKGYIFALLLGDVAHLSVRGLLTHNLETGWVQVDMGAIPFICNGANVMSAGINDVSPEISKGQFVWIREENHHKPLGVGRALLDGKEILESKQGKAIQALHYIGDKIWEYGVKD